MAGGGRRLGLVALGDSITNGDGTMMLGVTARSWAQWLAQAMGLPYTGRAADGATAPEVASAQLAQVREDYDVGCLYVGVNDVRSVDYDQAAFEGAFTGALAGLTARARQVVTLTIPLDLGRPRAGAKVAGANALIRRVAAEHGAACGDLDALGGPLLMMPDAVHPTALGQLRIADVAAWALRAAGTPVPVLPSSLAEIDDRPPGLVRYGATYAGWLARDLARRRRERRAAETAAG